MSSEQTRKVWSRTRGEKVDLPYKRMNIIHDYNHNMNQVDRQDHLRGCYRPDGPWMRNRKWWWSLFLYGLGVAATDAFLCYKEVCLAEGIKERRISHRAFMEELSDQLCHPERRVPSLTSQPAAAAAAAQTEEATPAHHGKRARTSASPSSASGPRPSSACSNNSDAPDSNKVSQLSWARVQSLRLGFDANEHVLEDPLWSGKTQLHRRDCQWCVFKWRTAGKPRDPNSKAKKYEGPQNKEIIYCTRCGCRLCSVSCLNELHGLVATENEYLKWPGASPEK